jgi:CO/xanthine dehydrogenase Mo-binding subunit
MDVVLQMMAEELGMNFLDFQRKIFTPDYHIQVSTERPMSSPTSLRAALEKAAEEIGYESKYMNNGTTLPDGRLYGVGIHAHYDRHGMSGTRRGVVIYAKRDGTFNVGLGCSYYHGTPIAVCHIVAEFLGVDRKAVQIGNVGDVAATMDGGSQAGSRAVCSNGTAAIEACRKIKEWAFGHVAEEFGVTPEDLDVGDGAIFVKADPSQSITWADFCNGRPDPWPFAAVGQSWGENLQIPISGPMGDFPVGTSSFHRTGVAGAFEVAVDPETGDVEVLSMVNVCDAGRVLDRFSAEGQINSGFWVQASMKGNHWNRFMDPGNGTLLSQTMLDDKMPTSMDLDETKNNPVLLETISHVGPFGAHGIGEPAATANTAAYINAVGAAIGQIVEERPIPPRRILELLGKA